MNWKQKLGTQIRIAREQAGLSQSELGQLIGKRGETIRQYELGMIVPATDTYAKLVGALGVDGFDVDKYRVLVARMESQTAAEAAQQLSLDFQGTYASSTATINIRPGALTITIAGIGRAKSA